MSNPISGHTAATSFSGSSGLRDGDSITSPSLTNTYEAHHGNGIITSPDGEVTRGIWENGKFKSEIRD